MAVVIPCAGRSSRFSNTRPKYLLTMHTGKLMIENAVDPYLDQDVHIVILKEHDKKYNVSSVIEKLYGPNKNVRLHILDEETSGPAETVYKVSRTLKGNEPLFIKDCDSFFKDDFRKDNHICVVDLRKNLDIIKVAAKSFAVTNNQMMITNVVEKSVVSNYICAGGYGFENAEEYNNAFEKISDSENEIFVSHVIKHMLDNKNFVANEVTNYIDVGTYNEFVSYNQSKTTIFCDIDGTVFYNQSRLFENDYSNEPVPISNAIKYLLQKQKDGCKIIFITSRPSNYKDITEKKLNECGFKNYVVIYDLPHAPRTLINDYSTTNPYPTAISINVPRDNNDFWINKG